jgi:polyphosphate kinase
MPRNLDHRIEVLVPIENSRVRQEIHAILDSAFADNTSAWLLDGGGTWTRSAADDGDKRHSHQATMMRRAQVRKRRGSRTRREQ